jgi:hypothetical protein
VLAVLVSSPGWADEAKEAGFVPMFNGKDLSGWVNVNGAPGTFFVKGGEIVTTGKPTGFLRTHKQYENFIAEFEWMHVNKEAVGNSGFFVWADPLPAVGTPYTRGIEVQVLVNLEKEGSYTSHGDLFSIHGATCKPDRPHPQGWARCLPSERRCKGGGEWNQYRVVARDGAIKLHVNGKEVSGVSQCRPRKGYLALESEGAECHFRNLKIQELPSTNPKADEIAETARGFRNLFTGLDLSGWKAGDTVKTHWQPRDWTLHYDGKAEAESGTLRSEREHGDSEWIADFRFSPRDSKACSFVLREGKEGSVTLHLRPDGAASLEMKAEQAGGSATAIAAATITGLKPSGGWNRLHATITGKAVKVTINGVAAPLAVRVPLSSGRFALRPDGAMDFGNLFVREEEK